MSDVVKITKETNAEYHADLSHYSHSMLEVYRKRPADFRDIYIDQSRKPDPPTEAMTFGSAAHAWVLEGLPPETQYGIIDPPVNPRTGKPFGASTQAYENYMLSLDPDREYITQQQCNAIHSIGVNVANHQKASLLLSVGGETEISVRWVRADGTKCKAKLDRVIPPEVYGDLRVVNDFKTAADPTEEGFQKATTKYGYHRQAAWYLDCYASDPTPTEFAFVVAGSDEPYDVYTHELDEDAIEVGRRENEELLRRIKHSIQTGVWTRPEQQKINTIELPRWYREIREPEE